MNKANTQMLYTDFPGLFRDATNPRSMMKYGFDCNGGWFELIYKLSSDIENEAKKLGLEPQSDVWPRALQVKEKFGTLKFYCEAGEPHAGLVPEMSGQLLSYRPLPSIKPIQELIKKAENDSGKICECCGSPGKFRRDGWWRVICDACEADRIKQDIHDGSKHHEH